MPTHNKRKLTHSGLFSVTIFFLKFTLAFFKLLPSKPIKNQHNPNTRGFSHHVVSVSQDKANIQFSVPPLFFERLCMLRLCQRSLRAIKKKKKNTASREQEKKFLKFKV